MVGLLLRVHPSEGVAPTTLVRRGSERSQRSAAVSTSAVKLTTRGPESELTLVSGLTLACQRNGLQVYPR